MTGCKAVVACLLLAVSSIAGAQEALTWLQRMNQAAKTLNYTGVFLYQSGGHAELSRVVHLVDAGGEQERVETLEAVPREVVRRNEDVRSFLPADRVVVVDYAARGRFPGRLTTKVTALEDYYNIRLGEVTRVAGRDAQMVILDPRDDMRYGHQFWADVGTGLLLKARVVNDSAQVVEQFAYTEITQGVPIERERLKPRTAVSAGWRVVDMRGNEVGLEELPWSIRSLPIGFRQVSLVKRVMRQEGPETFHLVLADGLASISVFIEPVTKAEARKIGVGASSAGSTGIFRRIVSDYLVTVVGEVPMTAIKRVAEGVEVRRK